MADIASIAKIIGISTEEARRRAVEALIREELRRIRSQKEAITGRYGVSSLEELMAKVEEGIISDIDAHDDIVRLDYLEYAEEQLLSMLEDLKRERQSTQNR